MRRFIYVLIFLSCFYSSQGKNYIGEVSKLYSRENLVIGTTSRIKFSAEININKESGNTQDFFQLDLSNRNAFMNIGENKISSINSISTGNHLYFKNSTNGEGLQELRFILEGELIFNWLSKSKNENIRIGYINSPNNPVFLKIDIEDLNPIHSLKIKVVDNMDLGIIEAGRVLSTKDSGTPANISVEGEESKRVSITIPKNTTIKNSANDTLLVNLNFRDNGDQKLIRELSPNGKNTYRVGNNGSVISKEILIDGESQTKRSTRGTYRGSFTVRVEYLD